MSIATQSLRYGWVALATLTIGTATIFVAPSVLRRITLKDRIEITLAIVERCYATQTGTNGAGEPVYAVAPPSIVRTWTDANGQPVVMTNALEWRDDLSMKVELDAKLKALCPYYGHTFTGLLTSLDLGDHTNFTAIPAIGTNVATFGPWAWRNYILAWQERYKVLNALKSVKLSLSWVSSNRYSGVGGGGGGAFGSWLDPPGEWGDGRNKLEELGDNRLVAYNASATNSGPSSPRSISYGNLVVNPCTGSRLKTWAYAHCYVSTNITTVVDLYLQFGAPDARNMYNTSGDFGFSEGVLVKAESDMTIVSNYCTSVLYGTPDAPTWLTWDAINAAFGYEYPISANMGYICEKAFFTSTCDFQYCTDKFW